MRLIDADVAIDMVKGILDLDKYYHPYATSRNVPIDEVIDRIEQTPTIEKELIRCKGCTRNENCFMYRESGDDNGYCAWAVKRDK